MTLSTYSTTTPADTDLEGDGASAVRDLASAIKERLELDHNPVANVDPTSPDCSGYHNQVTLNVKSSAPSVLTDGAVIYALDNEVEVTGDTTNGSAVIANVSDTSSLFVGMKITGTGIPASTIIESVDSSSQITLSQNCTATYTTVSLTCALTCMYFKNSIGAVRIR